MSDGLRLAGRGPFRCDQLRSGDPYELSQGHPIYRALPGRDVARLRRLCAMVLDSDPAVLNAGVDTGLALGEDTLRAPDVAVNFDAAGDGVWATGAALVVEYAEDDRDDDYRQRKIAELLAAGIGRAWVVRMHGARRVEVHAANAAVITVGEETELTAPGVLELPVPVRALYERSTAHDVTLRNLLATRNHRGREEALRSALTITIEARGWSLDEQTARRVNACRDTAGLRAWIARAVTAETLAAVFTDG